MINNSTVKKLSKKELKEIIQSGHINLLIGSGCSQPFLNTLGDIEKNMNDANPKTKTNAQKEYYELIKKSKDILDNTNNNGGLQDTKDNYGEFSKWLSNNISLQDTKDNYGEFLNFWAKIISIRSLHIINKQVNIFTTNFDMFIEDACESRGIPYNDGFAGQINPVFSVSNYNKIQKYKSLQFDNTSDIPLFNIIKLHGSVSWEERDEKIVYSDGSHIDDDFGKGYSKIAIINPNAEKHLETVLGTNYASMLRKFTLELEKENSVLMIFGFSLHDKHIKDLLYGVMK